MEVCMAAASQVGSYDSWIFTERCWLRGQRSGRPQGVRRAGIQAKDCVLVVAAAKDDYAKEVRRSLARSTRALPIRLVTVGKHRDSAIEKVVLDYAQKVRRYCSFEEVQVRPNPKNTSDVETQVAAEGDQVLRGISPKDWVVLLDERGRDTTSEQLATLIADAGETGASAVVFCIGGPFGHGPQVSERANTSVRLSSMVLNHEVARIVLVEQIYRAWTILRGEKYHH